MYLNRKKKKPQRVCLEILTPLSHHSTPQPETCQKDAKTAHSLNSGSFSKTTIGINWHSIGLYTLLSVRPLAGTPIGSTNLQT